MRIKVTELGPIRQAEFEVAELTTICGQNNTGKTYVTHALFGFLDFFNHSYELSLPNNQFKTLLGDGKVAINLETYHAKREKYLAEASRQYSKAISRIFAAPESAFKNTHFKAFGLETNDRLRDRKHSSSYRTKDKPILQIEKAAGSYELVASLLLEQEDEESAPLDFSRHFISQAIKDIVFDQIVPKPFISSAERTGAAIFQKELDFTRNRLLEILGDRSAKLRPFDLLGRFQGTYPVAVRKNVDFIRELSTLVDRESFLLKDHPDLLSEFSEIIGGEYKVNKEGDVQYIPADARRSVKLALVESSSCVRSLLDLGFYLRHIAQPGQLLIVDEPELNLHPENQRRIARLFARLVNLGVHVFITTHSDYIIKELNTLLMLGPDLPRLRGIAQREGYHEQELLKPSQIKAYIATTDKIKLDGNERRSECLTLVAAKIDSESGIELQSFDDPIREMNRIQEEIIWGGDE